MASSASRQAAVALLCLGLQLLQRDWQAHAIPVASNANGTPAALPAGKVSATTAEIVPRLLRRVGVASCPARYLPFVDTHGKGCPANRYECVHACGPLAPYRCQCGCKLFYTSMHTVLANS